MRVACVRDSLLGLKSLQRSVHTAQHAWSPRCVLQTRQTTNTRLGKIGDLRSFERLNAASRACQSCLQLALTTTHTAHVCRQAESSQCSIYSLHPTASIQHSDPCSHASLWADDCLSQNAAGACDQLAGPALCLHLPYHCNCHCHFMSLCTQMTSCCCGCCCCNEPILAIKFHP